MRVVVQHRSRYHYPDRRCDRTAIVTGKSVVSTSTGFSGQGTSSFVGNGQVERFHFLDMLSNDEGDHIQARGVFVFDISTGTARVDSFELICVGS